MESKVRCVWFLLVVAVVVAAGVETVRGAGECGRVPVDQVALKLAPCAAATQNPRAAVPPNCCAQVRSIGRNPKCLCAVMLSNTARSAGVKPAVAMTIPKRCAIANRPIGYKCGRKFLLLLLFFFPSVCFENMNRIKSSVFLFQLCSIHPAMRSKGMELEGHSNTLTIRYIYKLMLPLSRETFHKSF